MSVLKVGVTNARRHKTRERWKLKLQQNTIVIFTNNLLILYSLFAFRIQLFLDHSKILTQDCDTPLMFVRKIFVIRYLYYNYEMYVLY